MKTYKLVKSAVIVSALAASLVIPSKAMAFGKDSYLG